MYAVEQHCRVSESMSVHAPKSDTKEMIQVCVFAYWHDIVVYRLPSNDNIKTLDLDV